MSQITLLARLRHLMVLDYGSIKKHILRHAVVSICGMAGKRYCTRQLPQEVKRKQHLGTWTQIMHVRVKHWVKACTCQSDGILPSYAKGKGNRSQNSGITDGSTGFFLLVMWHWAAKMCFVCALCLLDISAGFPSDLLDEYRKMCFLCCFLLFLDLSEKWSLYVPRRWKHE